MKNLSLWGAILAIALPLFISSCQPESQFSPSNLRCEYLTAPLAVATSNPRLSWEIENFTKGYQQSAYLIQVGAELDNINKEEGLIWSSGKVSSNQSNQVIFEGKGLEFNQDYYWRVKTWDAEGLASQWSKIATFHTALSADQWHALWIGLPPNETPKTDYTIPPSPMLRKEVKLSKPVEKALLFSSAKGIYEASINGEKIGEAYLAPGWTDFGQRIQYQVNDVTGLLVEENNCIGVVLADGWYAGRLGPIDFNFKDYPWRGWYGRDLRFIGQLEIWYTDGSRETIGSDSSWKVYENGPIQEADIFIGVTYDFNKELSGWDQVGYNEVDWKSVYVEKPETNLLMPQIDQEIEIMQRIPAKSVQALGDSAFVIDMGQNMVGWLEIELSGNPGDTVVLKHAEMLNADGSVYRDNLRNAPQIDRYVLGPTGVNTARPLFTFHGFQFVQVEGITKAPTVDEIWGEVLVSATPQAGWFSCSNDMLNQLWENIRWTQWGNQISVPTDCPQRSERMGWMGDAQVFAQTAIYNHDMSTFYTKWGIDIMQGQFETGEFSDVSPRAMPWEPRFFNAPGWADAGLIVPHRLYENYGDERVLESHYESMKKYVDRIHSLNTDLIYLNGTGHAYNDWLNGNTIISEEYPKTGGEIPRPVFNTAFFIRSIRLLAKAAEVTGREDDHRYYSDLAAAALKKFQDEFLQDDGTIMGETQAGYAIALSFDLVPENLRMAVTAKLVKAIGKYDNRMSTGFISTICMMDELSEMGYHELACQLAESTRFPSWGYSIEQGATTIWERWDAYVKDRGFQNAGMNSFNHYTFGSIGEWMYKHVVGIKPDPQFPGWKHFYFTPKMGGSLTWAKGAYHSMYGMIEIDWEMNHTIIEVDVKVPANSTATFILPVGYMTEVHVDGDEVVPIPADRAIELGSGAHHLKLIGK